MTQSAPKPQCIHPSSFTICRRCGADMRETTEQPERATPADWDRIDAVTGLPKAAEPLGGEPERPIPLCPSCGSDFREDYAKEFRAQFLDGQAARSAQPALERAQFQLDHSPYETDIEAQPAQTEPGREMPKDFNPSDPLD